MSILYSQRNVLELAGLGEQQFRNWKKVVLKGLAVAKTSKFDLSEVIAIYLLSHLARQVGIQASHLARYAPSLFELCAVNGLDELADRTLVLGIADGAAGLRNAGGNHGDVDEIAIVLDDVVSGLRTALLHAGNQLSLPLTAGLGARTQGAVRKRRSGGAASDRQ